MEFDLVNSSLSEEARCQEEAAEVRLSKEEEKLRQD
jgi:hypothetical protein